MWSWIKNIFKKETFPTEFKDSNKIALIVGHTFKKQGADNYKDESEYIFYKRIVPWVQSLIGSDAKVFFRDKAGIKGAYREAANWGASTSIEFHFNWHSNPVLGSEMLVYTGAEHLEDVSTKVKYFMKQFNEEYDIPLRHGDGIKLVSGKESGCFNLRTANNYGIRYAMLFEPVFANFITDSSVKIFEKEKRFINFLAKTITEMRNLKV